MSIINAISAIGNNNTPIPLLIRDCGIENVAKVVMTYKQNAKESKEVAKHATRERIIDEYGTSAVWLGGIPAVEFVADKIIKKSGYNPKVNPKLFKETAAQGIDLNIKKFAQSAPDAVKDLIKVKNNKANFEKILGLKFLAATIIPIIIMGYILPKSNFAYTNKKINKQNKQDSLKNKEKLYSQKLVKNINEFGKTKTKADISFTGALGNMANLSTVNKMLILDGGLSAGRVGTARNKNEKLEMAFKMAGMCYLNYLAPKQIAKILDKITGKIFKLDIKLDPTMLTDKKFLNSLKDLKLPKSNSELDLIKFIDQNPQSIFAKFAQKANIIKMINDKVRDPRFYVDTKELKELKQNLETFAKNAIESEDIQKFAKRATKAKCFNIIANIGISSALLALALPKLQFMFRKLVTGSDLDPGISGLANK